MKSNFTLLFLFTFWLSQTVSGQINHEWSFGIGSKKSEGSGGSVVDHEGSIYILMQMKDTVDVDPGPATVEIIPETDIAWVLTKYDANGNLVYGYPFYATTGSGGAVMEARHNHIQVNINFNDSLVYERNGARQLLHKHPGSNSSLLTLDLDGNIVDSYFFAVPDEFYVQTIYTFADGRKLIAGAFEDTLVFNPSSLVTLISDGKEDAYLMMTDRDYVPIWTQQFGGTGPSYFTSFTVKNDRIYFTAVYEDTMHVNTVHGPLELHSAGEEDPLFGYISMTGALENIFTIKGPAYDDLRDIDIDEHGDMYVSGEFEETVNFGHPDQALIFRTAVGEADGFVAKYNEDGRLLWIDVFPCTGYGGVYTVDIKRGNELYVSGTFTEIGDLDPGPDSIIVQTGYDSSPFISKLNLAGELIWSTPFLTNEVAGFRNISILTEESRIVVNGFYYDSLHCGTVAGENWLNTDHGADCFVASYSEENVITAHHEIPGQVFSELFNVFPNPVTENFTIKSAEELTSLSIYNASGKLVRQLAHLATHQLEMNLNDLPAGPYYITGSSQDKIMTRQVIKQ